jgi:hypothetical protein
MFNAYTKMVADGIRDVALYKNVNYFIRISFFKPESYMIPTAYMILIGGKLTASGFGHPEMRRLAAYENMLELRLFHGKAKYLLRAIRLFDSIKNLMDKSLVALLEPVLETYKATGQKATQKMQDSVRSDSLMIGPCITHACITLKNLLR